MFLNLGGTSSKFTNSIFPQKTSGNNLTTYVSTTQKLKKENAANAAKNSEVEQEQQEQPKESTGEKICGVVSTVAGIAGKIFGL